MVRAISPARRLAQGLLAFALASALAAEPALAQAQDNPAAPARPGGDLDAARERSRAAAGRKNFQPRRTRKAARPDRALSRPLAGAAPARQRLPGADRPGAALARQEQGRRRQQRLFRDRQPELGSGGQGARALSRRHQEDERGSRLDDGPRRRRSEPAPGRRRRHPGASRQGATERHSQDDRATDGHDHPATGRGRERGERSSVLHRNPADRPGDGLRPLLRPGLGL